MPLIGFGEAPEPVTSTIVDAGALEQHADDLDAAELERVLEHLADRARVVVHRRQVKQDACGGARGSVGRCVSS